MIWETKKISIKTPYYQKSKFFCAQEVAKKATDSWDKNEIEKRSIDISTKLYGELWAENAIEKENEIN